MSTAFINGFPPPRFYHTDNWREKLELLGANTGNWVYIEEARKQIDYAFEGWLHEVEPRQEEFTAGIMPVSNILRTGYDGILEWVDAIERLRFPVTFVGLGTQSMWPDQYTPKQIAASLKPEVVRAFQRVAAQTKSLGVRGASTGEVLDRIGIHNYRVIGCPSFYQHLDGVFRKRRKAEIGNVLFNMNTSQDISGKIFEMGEKYGAQWVMQVFYEGAEYLCTKEKATDDFIRTRLHLDIAAEQVDAYIKENGHIFFDTNEWRQYLSTGNFSFSFGMRFHGNMMAHLNGIPALWITHDLRTIDLIETLSLPHITAGEFMKIEDMEELIDKCNKGYENTEKFYHEKCKEYVRFLEENGVRHRFDIVEDDE